jgi:predicted acetyltransferase
MQVRPITQAEHERAQHVKSTAFLRVSQDISPEDTSWRQIRAAFDDDGTMMSCVHDMPFVSQLNGHMVGMCGIGGVASLPEYRRRGSIRAIMQHILDDAYARGDVLSTLYPFSFAYYRKFGYEVAQAINAVTIPMSQMAHYAPFGTARAFAAGDDLAPFQAVYAQFIKGRNLACDRDDAQTGRPLWHSWLGSKFVPGKIREYAYLWRDTDGTPGAYALVCPQGQGDDTAFEVYDYAFVSPRAFRGLMGFLRLLDGQASSIRIRLPEDMAPHTLFPQPYDITVSGQPRGMVRLVHVEKALHTLAAPGLTGEVVLGVQDDMLPQNSGAWLLSLEDGHAYVQKTDKASVFNLNIGLLSQLVCGTLSFEQATYLHDFSLDEEQTAFLTRVFPKRKQLLIERF